MDPEEIKELQKKTSDSIKMLELMQKGERIEWLRKSPTLRRDLTIYVDLLKPEQIQRLDEIEKELIEMAFEAKEETTVKKILKAKKKAGDE